MQWPGCKPYHSDGPILATTLADSDLDSQMAIGKKNLIVSSRASKVNMWVRKINAVQIFFACHL